MKIETETHGRDKGFTLFKLDVFLIFSILRKSVVQDVHFHQLIFVFEQAGIELR